jgi:hypothetical protein
VVDPPFLQRVREWLGSVSSSPEEIERIVTEATVDWGGRDLNSRAEQLAFVDGPLTGAVSRALPPHSALRALRTIGSAVALEGAHGDRATPVYGRQEGNDRITGRVPVVRERTVPVLVVAHSDVTANRLSVLLGEERARVEHAHDKLTFVAGLAEHPKVVVIDATDAPALSAPQIVSFVERGLPDAFWVVWGKDRDLGRGLEVLLRNHLQPHLLLNESDGLGPILDVVLSRRAT